MPPDALLCQPAMHGKWATFAGGRITGFTTTMTGELFALLRNHGLLSSQRGGTVSGGAAFHAGVVEGARRDLAASLFGIRASGLLALRDDADAVAHASGLLIGADAAARMTEATHDTVHVLADPALGGLYSAAIETLVHRAVLVDSHAAFVAGITRIGELST